MPPVRLAHNSLRGVLHLALAVGCIALVWLVVLPQLGRQANVRAMIDRNEALGIDPSAKFYTELPGMDGYLERVESRRRIAGAAFWGMGDPEAGRVAAP